MKLRSNRSESSHQWLGGKCSISELLQLTNVDACMHAELTHERLAIDRSILIPLRLHPGERSVELPVPMLIIDSRLFSPGSQSECGKLFPASLQSKWLPPLERSIQHTEPRLLGLFFWELYLQQGVEFESGEG